MKKIVKFFKKDKKEKKTQPVLKRADLERKAVEGAEKAVQEYRRVFERLAEYDRT
jgi:hypothetical protein